MSKAFKSGELLGKGILDMTKVYSQQSAQEFLKGVVAALSKEVAVELRFTTKPDFVPPVRMALCITNDKEGRIDSELKLNKSYCLINDNVQVMGEDRYISVIGESGVEIERPASWFTLEV